MTAAWRLNMGCGQDVRAGYVNADRVALPGVDVVANFTRRPFSFRENAFDEVYMSHVLEHLPDTTGTMEASTALPSPGPRSS